MLAIFKPFKWIFLICLVLLLVTPMANLSGGTNNYNKITYVAIGDSLTEGLLADRTISDTNGYVGYITDALNANGYQVETYNFAKSGATSLEVLAQLDSVHVLRHDPNIVTVSVGVNDLTPHLKPIQRADFKEKLYQARTTLQLYHTYLSNLHDVTVYTEKSYENLAHHLIVLQTITEQTLSKVDIVENKSKLTDYISAIENALAQIKNTTQLLSSQKLNKNKQVSLTDLNDLSDTVQAAKDDLTFMHDETLHDITHIQETELFSKFEDSASSFIEEPHTYIENTNKLIKKVDSQLQLMDDKLHDIEVIAEIVPKSEEIIDKSMQKIEASFKDAHGEIDKTGGNINSIIKHLQEINPDVNVYILGYYNMFPYLSDGMQLQTTSLLTSLNQEIETIAKHNDITFVPNYDVFEGNYKTLLPNKHDIHPSIEGYQALAKEFITAINEDYPPINLQKFNQQ